jgi:hypothetical protein
MPESRSAFTGGPAEHFKINALGREEHLMRFCLCASLALTTVFLWMAVPVRAGTDCDNQYLYPKVFCDSFDTYCSGAQTNPCPEGTPGNAFIGNDVWVRTSSNYHVALQPDGTLTLCGATFDISDNQAILTSTPYGGRWNNMGDENGDLGQETADMIPGIKAQFGSQYDQVQGTDAAPLYVRFWLSGGLRSAAALDLSNGYLELALEQEEEKKAKYLDPEVTPTDYIMVGSQETEECISCFASCRDQFGATDGRAPHTMWPTVCQSYDARSATSMCPNPADPGGPDIPCNYPPPYCPPASATIHKVLAIGPLAKLDPNPCHCENPVKPGPCPGPDGILGTSDDKPVPEYYQHTTINPHLAIFDGLKWRALREGHYGEGATGTGDFIMGDKYDLIEMWIKTSTIDVHHRSRQWVNGPDRCAADAGGHWEDWVDSYAYNIPRKYTGMFNVLRAGTAPGCELKDNMYDCKIWAGTRCYNSGGHETCNGGPYVDDGSNYTVFDGLHVEGGAADAAVGACCKANTDCVETDAHTCEAILQGRYQGGGSTCQAGTCPCPIPYADGDHDGDVDVDDFGGYQLCYNGSGAAPTGCECYDRNVDGKVDVADLDSFSDCFTGPNVPWSQAVTPDCEP